MIVRRKASSERPRAFAWATRFASASGGSSSVIVIGASFNIVRLAGATEMIGSLTPPLALTAFLAVYAPTLQKMSCMSPSPRRPSRSLSRCERCPWAGCPTCSSADHPSRSPLFRWDRRQINWRPDHHMEFFTHDGGMETSASAGGGTHDRAQARRSDSALRSAVRRLNLLSFVQNRSSR